ncbi:T9SS type A sorting domain-containing protein [Aureispira anguillae]|uniref:T9SS type A sorting domain-containing protein n=1 Tax=Aureispira anguillae TaxID=2864201 RepID=A0A916DRG0_9BACT|nr:T9SS type A sorting domain-containing protein [Aureispira anguillae]BDS10362.1 T9SS type A sorting domain-containing protein [Aureispira anguillae]
MKKNTYLLFVISYLLTCFQSVVAQNVVTIGTSTANSSDLAPINRYYTYSTSEIIYTSSEIGYAGNITKLAFQKASGASSVSIDNVSIYLKTSSNNSLSAGSTDSTTYTLVWAGSFPNTMPNGWAEVSLNSPFYYNGSDNLQVLVLKGNQTYASSRPYYHYTSTGSTYLTKTYKSDSAPWDNSQYLSTTYNRPNIQLTIASTTVNDAGIVAHQPQLLCPGTANITASLRNFGTQNLSTATIHWSVNSIAQTPIHWTGSLSPNQQISVSLGTYTFNQGNTYNLAINSVLPNAVTDENQANDHYNTSINLSFTGTYTIGGTAPNYADLSNAIADLAANGVCGPVILELRDGTYSGAVTIPEITGMSTINTLTIRPELGASNVVITSNHATATLTFDAADHVTIDGRSGGAGSNSALDIDNSNNDASTVYLVNGATYNTIQHCHLRNHCWEASKGVITFGDDGWSVPVTSGGNSYNLIQYNHIRESVSGSTYQAIVSQAPTANKNSHNTILRNSIYNYNTEGILLDDGNEYWTINNNSFYQHTSRSGQMIGILIKDGTGYSIEGNGMGGADDNRGGTPTTATGSGRFTGIKIESGVGTGTVNILNNIIANIKTAYYFSGIDLSAGTVRIEGNRIGGYQNQDKIESEWRPAVGIEFYGSDVNVTIKNNTIGNIHFNSSSSSNHTAYGIQAEVGNASISNNDIFYITSNGSYSSYSPEDNVAAGIYVGRSAFASGGPYPLRIEGNQIHHIQQLSTSDIGPAAAIYIEDEKNSDFTITRNKIYEINTTAGNHNSSVWGIYTQTTGDILFANNQIKVGRTTSGTANVKGIESAGTTGNKEVYYNTIVIDGTSGATASVNSFCLLRQDQANLNLLNNAFINNRSGGTGKHYCLGNNSANPQDWSSNYNFFANHDINALNQWNHVDKNFGDWKLATASSESSWADDLSQINLNNLFDNFLIGHLDIDPAQRESWYLNGKGVQIPSITEDVNHLLAGRSTIVADGGTDIGANEFTPTVSPQELSITGNHTLGGIEILSFANRPVAKIEWGNTGVLPSIQSAQYYSGTSPNDPSNNGAISSPKHFDAYWKIAATGGSDFTYTITLLYDDALIGTIPSESLSKLAKKITGSVGTWQSYNSTVNSSSNELSYGTLNSFSEFTGLLDASTLPIDLLSFSGQKINANIELQWTTSSETNNAYFTLQKSVDGINWQYLDTVSGQGTTTQPSHYTYTDVNPFSSYNYYRLLQTDFSGAISNISNVIMIYFDTAIKRAKQFPPSFWINSQKELCFMSERNSSFVLQIFNTLGQVVYKSDYNSHQGLNRIPLPVNNTVPCAYIISISNKQSSYSQKVIVH